MNETNEHNPDEAPQPEAQSHEEPDGCPTEGARLRREWKQQSARIAELERRVEELTEEKNTYESHMLQAEGRVATLRAEVERLTKERDEARAELQSKLDDIIKAAERIDELKRRADHWCDMHTVASRERDTLRAQLAEREEDRAAAVREASIERERAGSIKGQNLHLVEVLNGLKAAIKNAPHGKNCDLHFGLCNCWKANL